ncbi:archaeal flagellin N-terminal-like domain-containing protein [Dactylonectria macrodidyma]|uniref:Archaeal flagellin N-terminal-like domain-containing protein n=1 Tax=Dactylonectria macrodidyma TaxID=307937 RepID=A0A9P9J4J3_9HYPO|nr:archaeal flagellin N-terminal-like domain-containing protein [Dactylonectria macrodidyma]
MSGGIDKAAVVPVEATLLTLAVILTSLRLFLRLVLQRTRLTVSDWLLVASVLDAVALLATDTMTYNLGGMDEYDPDAPPTPVADEIASMKIAFAGNYFYDTGIYFPKLALLAFYYRLIPPTMPKLRKFLHATTGITVLFAITTCFVDTFWCGSNVPVNWDPEGSCSSFTSMDITRIDWALNMTADLLIFSIPFFLLRDLRINRRYMIGLVATFSLGLITVCASVVRFATLQAIHAWTNVYVLSMVEMVAAIVVVCLPALKSLLRRGEPSTSKRGISANTNTSRSKTYNAYGHGPGTSHIKLSSGRDTYVTGTRATTVEESGSEVELHNMRRADAIYKTQRLSITSISEWILLAVAYVFVALRVYTRLFRLRQKLDWSDWLLVISAVDALGLIICDTLTYQMGVLDEWAPSVKLSKISFASNYFYDVGMVFPKLSMLAFYWGYFLPDISLGMRRVLYGITAFVCASYTAILWDDTFFCGKNVSVQWSQEDGACSVFYAPEPFILNFTLNLACYLAVYALPAILLIQGVLKPSKGLILTFVLGTLTIFSTVVRFACLKIGTGQENLVYPLSMVEITLALTVVALPGLKSLVGSSPSHKPALETTEVGHEIDLKSAEE